MRSFLVKTSTTVNLSGLHIRLRKIATSLQISLCDEHESLSPSNCSLSLWYFLVFVRASNKLLPIYITTHSIVNEIIMTIYPLMSSVANRNKIRCSILTEIKISTEKRRLDKIKHNILIISDKNTKLKQKPHW